MRSGTSAVAPFAEFHTTVFEWLALAQKHAKLSDNVLMHTLVWH